MDLHKYFFIRALRPFSFSVALIACGVGLVAAVSDGYLDVLRLVMVVVGGVLIQAAVNLINDHSDIQDLLEMSLSEWPERDVAIRMIQRNFKVGVICAALACAIGVWLISLTNLGLFILCLLGLLGGYFYTAEPINYKRRGLGVVLVFWFTGVLMVCGAYYALAAELNMEVFYLSLPVAILSSLLLLSNELRDVDQDRQQGLNTLTVRVGVKRARVLYMSLLIACYAVCVFLWQYNVVTQLAWLLPSLLFSVWLAYKVGVSSAPGDELPPLTGRFFLMFGAGFLLMI